MDQFEGMTRFQGDSRSSYQQFLDGAVGYPHGLSDSEKLGFRQKPFDWNEGHPSFFNNSFQLLNGLAAMNLAPGSTILEIGSGAGWITEILACLNYKVHCIEPAEAMVEAASERLSEVLRARAMGGLLANVTFHCTTLERYSADGPLFDGVLCFESFHHLIDEHEACREIFKVLKPGGVLCILGESNWIPGLREAEQFWEAEMDRFGTLESPYTHEYLHWLLLRYGFVDVTRNHCVNTLVPVDRENEPVLNFVGSLHARYLNLFLARKPPVDTPHGHEEEAILSREIASGPEIESGATESPLVDRAALLVKDVFPVWSKTLLRRWWRWIRGTGV